MRIAIDGRSCQNISQYRGIGTYSSNLMQTLMKVNGTHQLIPFGFRIREDPHGVHSSFSHLLDGQGFRITGRRSLLDQLTKHSVDLCHVMEFVLPFANPDRTLATVYDLIPLIFSKAYLRWRTPRFTWTVLSYYRFLKKVRRIAAVSHHTKTDLIRFLNIPQDRIEVIYPGINPAFRPLPYTEEVQPVLRQYGIPIPYVLYVGSCDYRKNIPGLMRAFVRFRTGKFKDFHLVLAGKLSEVHRKSLQDWAVALGLTGCLHPVGYVPLGDLVALYNGASMLVYPSLYEGFGFPPLEAMACGIPVVTSNNSSLPEVTDGCALLEDPCNPESLAEAMRRLVLDRGLRDTLIQKGLTHIQKFNWDRTAQETLRVYEKVGNDRRSRECASITAAASTLAYSAPLNG